MAKPMTPDQIVRQFKKWNVPFKELPGWRTHERDDETGLSFGPVFGGVQHHTGDDAPDSVDSKVIWNGRSDLPGPLAHFGARDDGVIELHSAGRANHAGGGDGRVKQAVINESYGKYPPAPRYHNGEPGATDGNDCFYGCEAYYSGGHKMTAKQYRSIVLMWAAICDFHGWSAKSIIGHKEWSDWKVDPGSLDMAQLRADIVEALRLGPPSQRKKAETKVTEAKAMLLRACQLLESTPDTRNLVHDVANKVAIQAARLPER